VLKQTFDQVCLWQEVVEVGRAFEGLACLGRLGEQGQLRIALIKYELVEGHTHLQRHTLTIHCVSNRSLFNIPRLVN